MALTIAPFQPLSATVPMAVQSGTTTMTFGTSVLGFPSVRIANIGTANAFIQFINTANTVTVGITNAVPIFNSSAVVLATGGLQAMAALCGGTFTTTIYVTPGQGGTQT